MIHIIKNKLEDGFENIEINLISELRKSGLSGKYIVDVEIKKQDKKFEKEYICSIVKKDTNATYVYLTHLDAEELTKIFNKIN